jgi:site-specific DNA-methyltransferase (adenine-specific)
VSRSNHQLVIDPDFAKLLIPLSSEELSTLRANILHDGCRDPLVGWQENGRLILLDGHNRLAICEQHGIEYRVEVVEIESREWVRVWIKKNQLGRRNLSDDARAMLAAQVLKDLKKLALAERGKEARQAVKARHPMKGDMSTTVVDKSGKAKKDNLAAVAKESKVSQRRVRLAVALEKKAVDVLGEDAAQKVCDEIGQGRTTIARARRTLAKVEAEKKLAVAKSVVRPAHLEHDLQCCSMEDFLDKARGIDCILTDPPYKKEFLPLYGELARLAAKALKPEGALAVMCGQSYLPEILAAMTEHMKFRWVMAYLMPGGQAVQLWDRKVFTFWKPILIFGTQAGDTKWLSDVVKSDVNDNDKRFHEWGQSESGFCRLIERLTEPDALVCDPFIGGGTTAVAAVRLHRRIIGCDIDPTAVETARARAARAQAEVGESRAREALPQGTPLADWVNKIQQGDCVEVMSQMPAKSIDLVVTSPPYNLRNSTGGGMRNGGGGRWENAGLLGGYDGGLTDDMPHAEYVAWQRRCLTGMMHVLKDDGAIFYNHKPRVQGGLWQDRDEIVAGFPVRQEIIWERAGGFNVNPGYFLPTYEVIYLICKPDFRLAEGANALRDVWHIPQESGGSHPAPFPVELAHRCIQSTHAQVVLDPFMGSGTTALAAELLGRHWIGIEQSQRYCDDANERLARLGGTFDRKPGDETAQV